MTGKLAFLMLATCFCSLQAQDYKVRSFCWERIEVTSELDENPSAEAADVMVEGGTATGLARADMGLINIGGLRNNMPEGIVRKGDIILISPFENYLVVLEMKGKDLLELMRNIAAVKGEGVSSSVRMEITEDGKLLSCTINGEEIDPKRIYTIATLDYLAEGNDKMYALKKAVKRHEIGILARDVMMEYVIKHRVIDSKIEGRIIIK